MTFLTTLAALTLLNGGAPMSADATAQYQAASRDIQARAYGSAVEKLNALALQYPKVAEIFASRCSALIASAQYASAEADCAYAIGLKPNLPEALYALAVAEDHQGKTAAATGHYRKYAAFDGAPMAEQAHARADALTAGGAPPMASAASGAGGRLTVYRNHRFAGAGPIVLIFDGHLLGDIAFGQYVDIEAPAGSHILEARTKPYEMYEMPHVWTQPITLGGGTVYLNFDTNGGQIVMQEMTGAQARAEMHEDCKRGWSLRGPFDNLPMAGPAVAQAPAMIVPGVGVGVAPRPQCHMGADGINECGYNCQMGSDGRMYCSSVPNGRCAFNADGTYSCP